MTRALSSAILALAIAGAAHADAQRTARGTTGAF